MVEDNKKLALLYRGAFLDLDTLDLAIDLGRNIGDICLDARIVLVDMGEPVEHLIGHGQKGANQEDAHDGFEFALQFQNGVSLVTMENIRIIWSTG